MNAGYPVPKTYGCSKFSEKYIPTCNKWSDPPGMSGMIRVPIFCPAGPNIPMAEASSPSWIWSKPQEIEVFWAKGAERFAAGETYLDVHLRNPKCLLNLCNPLLWSSIPNLLCSPRLYTTVRLAGAHFKKLWHRTQSDWNYGAFQAFQSHGALSIIQSSSWCTTGLVYWQWKINNVHSMFELNTKIHHWISLY